MDRKGRKITISEQRKRIMTVSEVLNRVSILLANVIESRDPYTRGHSEHVAELTVNMARSLFPRIFLDIQMVKISALLHDIGKIGITETVLNKPTLLTEAELIMIRSHTILGEKLIEPLMPENILRDAVRFHHENFDGSGYPDRLSGKGIPLIARIIRLADYFDALTSNRPYRPAMTLDEACRCLFFYPAGKIFSPDTR